MAILTVSMRGGKRTLQATPAEWNSVHQRLTQQEANKVRPNTELLEAIRKAAYTKAPATTVILSASQAEQILSLNS